ncbi:hypothetical protein C8R45DRAFT_1075771 [Mycena sanguinolenta]|nr:hypothetical protein C8R45DRAFT_1075771 [Mycena sanguinolenta]
MSLVSPPSFELVLDDLLTESAFNTLVADEPLDAIRDAFSDLVVKMPVPGNFDASAFNLHPRCGLEYVTPEGNYLLPEDRLMHYDPYDLERTWSLRPVATTPYGMGLSFETSGWRAPAYRSPECREIESRCIDPALLLGDAVEAEPESRATSPVASAEDYSMSVEFETPEAVPDNEVEAEEDESEDDEDDEDDNDAADSDFEEVPKRTRVIRPLPRRAVPKAITPLSTARSSRASAPVSKKSASATKKSGTRRASTSTSTTTASGGKKRKAASARAGPQPKKAAVARRTSGSTSFQLPHIPGVTDPGLPAPANSGSVCATHWPLLRLGCEVVSEGVQCNINGCSHTTNSWSDMGRHVPAVHFRAQGKQLKCDACPRTFARSDARQRHLNRKTARGGHFTAARKAFLLEFNERADVVAKRNNCAVDSVAIKQLNAELDKMFDNLLFELKLEKA